VTVETSRFPVAGMTCSTCVVRITRAVRAVPGVTAVRVDLGRESATVRRDPGVATDADLVGAIRHAGYEADVTGAVAADEADLDGPLVRLLHRVRRNGRNVTQHPEMD
jgi:P-type Cu+ transporter